MTPTLALTVGDPAGIGPELARAALRDPAVADAMRLVVLGPAACRPDDLGPHAWQDTPGPERWTVGDGRRP